MAIAGVLLVFCYLIVPSVAAMLYADSIGKRLAIGWTMGTVVSALGVYLSLKLDLPTGATIVCTFGMVLIIMAAVRPLIRRGVRHQADRSAKPVTTSIKPDPALSRVRIPHADPESHMKCRQCGTEIADKAIVCYRCGTATTEAKFKAPPARPPRSPINVVSSVLARGAAGALRRSTCSAS